MRDAVGDRPVAGEDGLGARVALARGLERDGAGADAAVDLGQGHVHGEIARAEAARAVAPDRPRCRRPGSTCSTGASAAASGSSRTPRPPTAKAVALRITAGPLPASDLVRVSVPPAGVLEAGHVEAGAASPALGRARPAARRPAPDRRSAQRAVEHHQRRLAGPFPPGSVPAGRDGRARRGAAAAARRQAHVAADQAGGVAQRLLGIVDAAMAQVAATGARDVRPRRVESAGELGVGAVVAGQAGQRDAAARGSRPPPARCRRASSRGRPAGARRRGGPAPRPARHGGRPRAGGRAAAGWRAAGWGSVRQPGACAAARQASSLSAAERMTISPGVWPRSTAGSTSCRRPPRACSGGAWRSLRPAA